MSTPSSLAQQIAHLSPLDRIALVEEILQNLDAPDPSVDALWAQEAESRLSAYKAGEIQAVSVQDVMGKYGQP